MSDDPHATGGPRSYVAAGARTPTHGERARTLVQLGEAGVLSTIALEPAGTPFGSLATYAVGHHGAPLVLMSTMAEHARNLDADPRCSLLVTADGGEGTARLAAARVTLLGRMVRLPESDQRDATEAYLAVHSGAFWARFPDFHVHRLDVEAVRYVRGFGEMSWVELDDFRAASPDPVGAAEAGIVAHMNDDHEQALIDLADHHLDVDGEVLGVTMTSCDRYGFEVQLALDPDTAPDRNEVAFGRIGFPEPLGDAAQARGAMVALVRALP